MFVLSFWQNLHYSLNPDTSWLIVAAEKMLQGKILGKDILEVNPPASTLLYIPSVICAQLFHIRAEIGVMCSIYLLTFMLCLFLLRVNKKAELTDRLAMNGMCLLFVALTCLYFQFYFSQREHYALILGIPYIIMSAVRQSKKEENFNYWFFIVSGVSMGISGCIKPVFFLVPLFCNLLYVFSEKRLKGLFWIENLIISIICFAYLLIIFIFFGDYLKFLNEFIFDAYFKRQQPWEGVFFSEGFLFVVQAAFYLLLTFFFRPSILQRQIFIASLGFYFAFLLQRKGYFYHVYPAFVLIYLSFFLLCYQIFLMKGSERFTLFVKMPVILFILYGTCMTATSVFSNWHITKRSLQAESYINRVAPHPTMASLAASFSIGFPLVRNVEGEWVTSLHSIITVTHLPLDKQQLLLDGDYDAPYLKPDKDLIKRAGHEIYDRRPDIVVIETLPEWLAFLETIPEAKEALSHYILAKSLDGIDIWVRKDLITDRDDVFWNKPMKQ